MSHKLQKVSWEYDRPEDDLEGQFYWADEMDKYLEELHKKIEELEQSTQSTICSTSEDTSDENAKKKLHYYCFSYSGRAINCGGQCEASTYRGYTEKLITKGRIDECKTYAGVTKDAVLISAVYLGYMTEDEVRG